MNRFVHLNFLGHLLLVLGLLIGVKFLDDHCFSLLRAQSLQDSSEHSVAKIDRAMRVTAMTSALCTVGAKFEDCNRDFWEDLKFSCEGLKTEDQLVIKKDLQRNLCLMIANVYYASVSTWTPRVIRD